MPTGKGAKALTPTDEQQEVLDNYGEGNGIVEAYAGTGKTATLRLLAQDNPRDKFFLVCYNRVTADDAKKSFPRNATCQPDGTMVLVPLPKNGSQGDTEYDERPIQALKVGDKVVSWHENEHTGIIRKRGSEITGIVKRDYDGDLVVVDTDGYRSRYTPEHPCIVSMDGIFDDKFIVYMMERNGYYKIGMCRGRVNASNRNGFAKRIQQEDADAAWILSVHETGARARFMEALYQQQFNIPGWHFRMPERNVWENLLWREIEPNHDAAEVCLSTFGREISEPLWQRGQSLKFGQQTSHVIAACNLLDGMRMLIANNAQPKATSNGFTKYMTPRDVWTSIRVDREPYKGVVTSLEVENDHTYFADGILTHNCRTMHSVAFGAVGVEYKHRLNSPRQRGADVAAILGIREAFKIDDAHNRWLRPWQLAMMTLEAVKRFCYSADDIPMTQHVKWLPGAEEVWPELANLIAGYANVAWHDITKKDDFKLSWGKSHDYYLKMWALTNPVIHTDCLMVDEAQDSNALVASIVEKQDAAKILVGDQYQQLYAWRGAEDIMASFSCEWRTLLSQSFRFGDAVAEEGNKWLTLLGAEEPLKGLDSIESEIRELPNAKAILCRTNATVIAEAMRIQEEGNTVGVAGGTGDIMSFAKAVQDLQRGNETSHPDLMGFTNWNDVKEYAADEGADLKVLVDMVDRYGVEGIIRVAEQAVSEEYADHIVTTAHKAKGREWRSVKLASDFKEPVDPDTGERRLDRAEFQLLYVACTRAKVHLDNSAVNWVDDWIPKPVKGDLIARARAKRHQLTTN
jgi:hypothetical protein